MRSFPISSEQLLQGEWTTSKWGVANRPIFQGETKSNRLKKSKQNHPILWERGSVLCCLLHIQAKNYGQESKIHPVLALGNRQGKAQTSNIKHQTSPAQSQSPPALRERANLEPELVLAWGCPGTKPPTPASANWEMDGKLSPALCPRWDCRWKTAQLKHLTRRTLTEMFRSFIFHFKERLFPSEFNFSFLLFLMGLPLGFDLPPVPEGASLEGIQTFSTVWENISMC